MIGIHDNQHIGIGQDGIPVVIRGPGCTHHYDNGRRCGRPATSIDPFWPYQVEQNRCAAHDGSGHLMTDDEKCPDAPDGKHDYKSVYEGWESETYQCKHCGDRYKLYDDEMR